MYCKLKHSPCYLLVLWLCLAGPAALCSKRDSLVKALNAHPQQDTTRVELLTDVAATFVQDNVDSMGAYAADGLALARTLNYSKGIANSSQQLGMVFLHKHESAKALQYFGVTLQYLQKTGNKPMQAEILIYMGDISYRDTRYQESIDYYNKAIALAEQSNAIKQQGLALIDIGGIYTEQGSYADAVEYYVRGLKIFEQDHDSRGIAMTLVNIANVYSAMGNFKTALEYINKSIPITESITDKEVLFSNMVNIGTAYSQMKDLDRALDAFTQGLLIADSLGDKSWQNACLGNIADVYYQKGQYDSAFAKYSRLIAGGLDDTTTFVSAKCALGAILLKRGRLKDAAVMLLDALKIAKSKSIRQSVYDASQSLSSVYEQMHDYSNALKYHKIASDYRDSLNNDQINKRIQQARLDHELGKKQQEIELLKKDALLAESRSVQQRVTSLAMLVGLLLLIVIVVILSRHRLNEKKRLQEIVRQKEDIQLQASQLEALNRFKDKTFSVISHDLRSPLGALTSTLMLLDNNAMSPDEFNMVKTELNNQLNAVNMLLDNLLNWSKSYFQGKLSATPEAVDVGKIVSRNIHLLQFGAAGKNIDLVNDVLGKVEAWCDPGQLDIVIRNLVSNAVKFTKDNGAIRVSANHVSGQVVLTVSDSGIGMTAHQLSQLFSTGGGGSTYGTAGEKGVGLGLALCSEFVKANNGTITASSEIGKGTSIMVSLPAAK